LLSAAVVGGTIVGIVGAAIVVGGGTAIVVIISVATVGGSNTIVILFVQVMALFYCSCLMC